MILSVATLNLPEIAFKIESTRILMRRKSRRYLPSRDIIFWATILILAQVIDGTLTSFGLSSFGNDVEGNAIIRHLAINYGYLPALILTKSVAITLVGFLALAAKKVAWIKSTLIALNCVYCFFAILPWTYLLFI